MLVQISLLQLLNYKERLSWRQFGSQACVLAIPVLIEWIGFIKLQLLCSGTTCPGYGSSRAKAKPHTWPW